MTPDSPGLVYEDVWTEGIPRYFQTERSSHPTIGVDKPLILDCILKAWESNSSEEKKGPSTMIGHSSLLISTETWISRWCMSKVSTWVRICR